MAKRVIQTALVLVVSILFFGCAGEKKLELKVKARLDGQPAGAARVMVDGEEQGQTDAGGNFSKILLKKPGTEIAVVVSKDVPGYHTTPWKATFVMKLPKGQAAEVYAFDADIPAVKYVTVVATEKGTPVQDAKVMAGGKDAGTTNAQGVFEYEYTALPQGGLDIAVSKPGYSAWRKTGPVEPGQKIEAALVKRVTVTVSALSEEYGQTRGIAGAVVAINNRKAGKTDARGVLKWNYEGEPGKKVPITLTVPGYLPETWKGNVALEGDVSVQHYFYPTTPKPIRTGIFRFAGNSPNADLTNIATQTEAALAAQLFKYSCFREVPSSALQADIKRSRLSIEKITTKGWQGTPLRKTVDMIILGSIAADDKGYLIETKFYTSGGKLILSQIMHAKSASDINFAAKEIASAVVERFPFEGTVVGADGERYRINLGKAGYRIAKDADFTVMTPRHDETGKVSGYVETGRLRVKKAEENGSWAEVQELKKAVKILIGDRVVRRFYREGEEESARNYFILTAKGGLPPDVTPLPGVNIYVNDEWLGTTGPDGKAEVPAPINRAVTLVLYRHGYQQVTEKIKIEKNRDAKEFVLTVNNALFRVDSQPQGADVFIDGEKIGTTPILDGRQVNLGFHTVRVAAGEDYRVWEEVVDFSKKEENWTAGAKVVLPKDYLKIGERAEQKGMFTEAIIAYQSATKGHPDYSEAHSRLARILLDERNDYDGAIREFENVLSLPENQQLIYKQFSVAFMNLGHAYYEKGNTLVQTDRDAAAQCYAKAIKNLQIAKQNMRFYPNDHYDEAVHDTYYYTALSYHKLYLITRKSTVLNSANLAWQEYFDFFPHALEGKSTFEEMRNSAREYWAQIKDL